MKKYCWVLLSVCLSHGLHAQNFSELFKQKKTQEKYLLRQIAELQGYITLAGKGYGIVSDGLGFIGDLKNGKLCLDKDYFSSLSNVSPAVRKDDDISNTLTSQNSIRVLYEKANKDQSSAYLSASEKQYIKKVWANLLDKCTDAITELNQLTTPGKYSMKEEERLHAIQKLQFDMMEKNRFADHFYKGVKILILQREKEEIGAKVLKRVYDKEN